MLVVLALARVLARCQPNQVSLVRCLVRVQTEKFSAFEVSLSEKVSTLMRAEVDKLLAGLVQPVESRGEDSQ